MKLILASLLLAIPSTAAHVAVVRDFLPHDEIDSIHAAPTTQAGEHELSLIGGFEGRKSSFVNLPRNAHQRICTLLGDSDPKGDCVQQANDHTQAATLLESSPPHADCHMLENGTTEAVDKNEKVGFVFLDNAEGAYFVQGDQRVPVQKGSMITFPGNVEHHTFLPHNSHSGVRLLGPFALPKKSHERGLSRIGMLLQGFKALGAGMQAMAIGEIWSASILGTSRNPSLQDELRDQALAASGLVLQTYFSFEPSIDPGSNATLEEIFEASRQFQENIMKMWGDGVMNKAIFESNHTV